MRRQVTQQQPWIGRQRPSQPLVANPLVQAANMQPGALADWTGTHQAPSCIARFAALCAAHLVIAARCFTGFLPVASILNPDSNLASAARCNRNSTTAPC